jgi:hypothetical protein
MIARTCAHMVAHERVAKVRVTKRREVFALPVTTAKQRGLMTESSESDELPDMQTLARQFKAN